MGFKMIMIWINCILLVVIVFFFVRFQSHFVARCWCFRQTNNKSKKA